MDNKLPYFLPVTIVIAGAIIAVALYTVRVGDEDIAIVRNLADLAPLSTEDHVLGSPTASVTLITYSDIDCEHCKDLRETMEQIVTEYGPTGEVAWVFRHFPNVVSHPYAALHAEASECVNEQSPELFFQFISTLNQTAPSGSQFNPDGYELVVENLGLSVSTFRSCVESDRMTKRVEKDFENALRIGANATPYSVLLVSGKKPISISGALPYEDMKKVIEESLRP
jgi:protein-disulfide isomerase